MARWLRLAINRCLYVRLSGYVGLGPGPTKAGDRIAMISGSGLLFLGRDKDPVHDLVGITYLYGLSGRIAGIGEMRGDGVGITIGIP